MKRKTKSILEEINDLVPSKSRQEVINSRASHVLSSVINFLDSIHESYDRATAENLERKLLNAVRARDASKFTNSLKRVEEQASEISDAELTEFIKSIKKL